MKTIEERAIKYQGDLASSFLGMPDLLEGAYNGYVKGATEQKAIDDADRDTAVYNLLQLKLDAEKKLWLDEACEWLKSNCGQYYDGATFSLHNAVFENQTDFLADFRKAMEE